MFTEESEKVRVRHKHIRTEEQRKYFSFFRCVCMQDIDSKIFFSITDRRGVPIFPYEKRVHVQVGVEVHDPGRSGATKKEAKCLAGEEGVRKTKYSPHPIPRTGGNILRSWPTRSALVGNTTTTTHFLFKRNCYIFLK